MADHPHDRNHEISPGADHEVFPDPTGRPAGFKVDAEIMAEQAAYIARGMTGASPDRDLWLIPEAVRDDLRAGFTRHLWTPAKDEAMVLSYDEMLARQKPGKEP
jgi:hypothetical protein